MRHIGQFVTDDLKGNSDVSIANTDVYSQNNGLQSTTISSIANSISGIGSSFKNKIINGNFDIWQRGTSLAAGTGGLLADRWQSSGYGSTIEPSRQAFTVGQTDVPYEPSYYYRCITVHNDAADKYVILFQRIENVRSFAGQTATLSFYAKADASKNIAIEFNQGFGSGGSPSASVTSIGVTTCGLTTSWQKFTVTVAVPSISGKTIGTNENSYFGLLFWFDSGSDYNARTNSLGHQDGTFDIAQVQLEAGSTATAFEMRPYGIELASCQRYCIAYGGDTVYDKFATGTAYSTTQSDCLTIFPVAMRAPPTFTQVGDVSWYEPGAGTIYATTLAINSVATSRYMGVITASFTGGTDNFYGALIANNQLSARLIWGAEL